MGAPHLDIRMEGGTVPIDYGRCYLFYEKRMDKTIKAMHEFFYSGASTLCITRMHPDMLHEKLPDSCHTSMWLSEQKGENNLSPNQLPKIAHTIRDFLAGKKGAVILLEGIEYLSFYCGSDKVQMFLNEINDLVMATRSVLIIPLDPLSLDPRSLACLCRYSEIVQ
jgi:hypothetical protein